MSMDWFISFPRVRLSAICKTRMENREELCPPPLTAIKIIFGEFGMPNYKQFDFLYKNN